MKVGIALHPALLVSKESQLMTLIVFFSALFVVPSLVLCCCLQGSHLSASGVSAETLRMLTACVDEDLTDADGPSLIAASAEVRWAAARTDVRGFFETLATIKPQKLRSEIWVKITGGEFQGQCAFLANCPDGSEPCSIEFSDGAVKEVSRDVLSPAYPQFHCIFSDTPVRKACLIMWAHMWRLHNHMPISVQKELDAYLRHSIKIGREMTSIAGKGPGDRSGFFNVVKNLICVRQCLVQALDLDSSPLLQIPHVTSVPPDAPTFADVVSGAASGMLDSLGLSKEQRLDIDAFCRHVPQVDLKCHVDVPDEESVAEGDLAHLKITLLRKNLSENEAAGPVHAPYFPGPKFEEWWLLVYDELSRVLITVAPIFGTGHEETATVRFVVPRSGSFTWTVHAMCDSYSGLDVKHTFTFETLRRNQVKHDIFIHPADRNLKSLFEELMEGLQPEEEEETDSEPETAPTKSVQEEVQKEEAEKEAVVKNSSDSSSDEENAGPEGTYLRIVDSEGLTIYRAPEEDPEFKLGTIPEGAVIRIFSENAPPGWALLALGQNAWLRVGTSEDSDLQLSGKTQDNAESTEPSETSTLRCPVEFLGDLFEQRLETLVETRTPLHLLRKWGQQSKVEITPDDLVLVSNLDEVRARVLIHHIIRNRVGDKGLNELMDAAEGLKAQKRARFAKALGRFATQNGMIWHISNDGIVRGIQPDGGIIRDRLSVTKDDKLQIGPFTLDESRTCSCIHWLRQDDPSKSWVWAQDESLSTRIRLGSVD